MRPSVGFRPTRPDHAAGMRIEPPASVPICNGPNPAAPAAPAPDEDPPGVWAGFQALRVMPCSGQSPGDFQPYSVVVVLPTITAPAAFNPTTAGASSATGAASLVRLPRRVGKPATSTRSFTVHGHAIQHSERASDAPAHFAFSGGFDRARVQHGERVERGVQARDAFGDGLQHLHGAEHAAGVERQHVLGGQQSGVGSWHGLFPIRCVRAQHGARRRRCKP